MNSRARIMVRAILPKHFSICNPELADIGNWLAAFNLVSSAQFIGEINVCNVYILHKDLDSIFVHLHRHSRVVNFLGQIR